MQSILLQHSDQTVTYSLPATINGTTRYVLSILSASCSWLLSRYTEGVYAFTDGGVSPTASVSVLIPLITPPTTAPVAQSSSSQTVLGAVLGSILGVLFVGTLV